LVRFEQRDALGVVTIDHPPLNLFSAEMIEHLDAALNEARRAQVRAVIVEAEGDVFSAGVDVHVFQISGSAEARGLIERVSDLRRAVEAIEVPTLAVVQGLCLTAGFELSLACDMIWAAESVRFGLVEQVVGVTPFMGGTQRIAERAGPARARELVMSGGLYPADQLHAWGVVNRVIPDDELRDKALVFAQRLASGPTQAHIATKRVVRAFLDGGVPAADAAIADIAAPLFDTRDLKHGVQSFLEKGPGNARFEGR
jgi:enoyl-CoA hydratase